MEAYRKAIKRLCEAADVPVCGEQWNSASPTIAQNGRSLAFPAERWRVRCLNRERKRLQKLTYTCTPRQADRQGSGPDCQ